jgi:DNA-binding CsgD family transcriptional regulator
VPPEDALRATFRLTTAEARLASRLATGTSLDHAADALGIARNTARAQLRAVFAKTDTSRQAELVALLARLARQANGTAPR